MCLKHGPNGKTPLHLFLSDVLQFHGAQFGNSGHSQRLQPSNPVAAPSAAVELPQVCSEEWRLKRWLVAVNNRHVNQWGKKLVSTNKHGIISTSDGAAHPWHFPIFSPHEKAGKDDCGIVVRYILRILLWYNMIWLARKLLVHGLQKHAKTKSNLVFSLVPHWRINQVSLWYSKQINKELNIHIYIYIYYRLCVKTLSA